MNLSLTAAGQIAVGERVYPGARDEERHGGLAAEGAAIRGRRRRGPCCE